MPKLRAPVTYVVDGTVTRVTVPNSTGGTVETLIDTGDLGAILNSGLSWRGTIGTGKSPRTYVRGRKQGKGSYSVALSRWLLGAPAHLVVDHVNRDTLDNRRCNLRLATLSLNAVNSGSNPRNTSGCRGVTFHKQCNKWQAQIGDRYIGVFDSPDDAARAYDDAAVALYGEFAQPNGGTP